jgi:hypothetical protein
MERDRELENLLGQFLVASYQSDKLAELIYERASRTGVHTMRLIIEAPPSGPLHRPPYLVTITIEPYRPEERPKEIPEGARILFGYVYTPPLSVTSTDEELLAAFQYWLKIGGLNPSVPAELRATEWVYNTRVLRSRKDLEDLISAISNVELR